MEVRLKHRIDEVYTDFPYYGSRKITAVLNSEGENVNRKRVQRYMREMGIRGICPGPNLSKRRKESAVYPYLLRGLEINGPNHVWGMDITYIRLQTGWLYLAAVLDWHSRYVLSWAVDQTLEMSFVMEAVEAALSTATPVIWNSDQGSHFTSEEYTRRLLQAGVRISMDGKGRALDNIFVERLWRSVKYEEVYLKDYATPKEARRSLSAYLTHYNEARPHQALGYRTPGAIYRDGGHAMVHKAKDVRE
jgi:putative transposase